MVDAGKKEDPGRGLLIVSVLEGAKGMLVLLVGFGLLELIHKDVHLAAEQIVQHFHLNPARRYPKIFIDTANNLTDEKLLTLAISAMMYSVVRFIEAIGLWRRRQWAEWFGLLTGGMYIPIELFEVTRGMTWPKAVVLTVNVGIVVYLASVLYRSRSYRDPKDS
jgi:uncharacterized membrane protein (DUF2068 family)